MGDLMGGSPPGHSIRSIRSCYLPKHGKEIIFCYGNQRNFGISGVKEANVPYPRPIGNHLELGGKTGQSRNETAG
jgi:hypothetical protein